MLLTGGDQFADHPVQRIVFPQAQQWADRKTEARRDTGMGIVLGLFQPGAQIADIATQAAGARQGRQVQAADRMGGQQLFTHQTLHGVGQDAIVQQVIAIEAVLVELVQVDVVQAGAAVDHAIIDHKPLEVQHAEQLTSLHRHAVDRHFGAVVTGLRLIPGAVARLLAGTDQAPLGPQPVDHDDDLQRRMGCLGRMQRIENLLPRLVLLQVQRHQGDASPCSGDLL